MTHAADDKLIETIKAAVAEHNADGNDLDELVERFKNFKLDGTTFWREFFIERDTDKNGKRYGMYDPDTYGEGRGDEFAPFFSEAFLYNLVGKDEARSILSMVRAALKLAGAPGRVV